jgi:signal transduction histidine kinase
MHYFRDLPLSRKILLGIVPLFLLFISVSVLLQNHFQEREMMEQAQLAASTNADIIRESLVSMMVNNLEVDSTFLERVNTFPQFDTVRVLINNLRLRPELMSPQRTDRLRKKTALMSPGDDQQRQVMSSGLPLFARSGDHYRGIIPFNATEVCQKCHAVPLGYSLGATDLSISFENISRAASGNWQRSLAIFIIFTGLVIGTATLLFTRFVGRPVEGLVRAANEISRGNLNDLRDILPRMPAPGTEEPGDELTLLAARFDDMRRALKEKIDQLDLANRTLVLRNREVEEALGRLRQAQEDLVVSERLAVTGKLTAQLSHEINNPIHNVQSLLESSLRKVGPESQAHELISLALDEISRMAKLTRSMLDLYRGSMVKLEQDTVDVEALLRDITRAYEQAFTPLGIRVHLEIRAPLPAIRGSRDKLKQVMLNLVNNARDAMPGGGTVTLRACRRDGMLCVEVSDTGVGIPRDQLNRVFDAFFTTKKEVSGVGLGLSVCYSIVHQHGGTITVSSTPGRQTTFTLLLPSIPPEPAPDVQPGMTRDS